MPRFKSEEARQQWIENRRATLAANKAGQAEGRAIVRENAASGTGIAGAIEEINVKIDALEGIRNLLLQAQELVRAT